MGLGSKDSSIAGPNSDIEKFLKDVKIDNLTQVGALTAGLTQKKTIEQQKTPTFADPALKREMFTEPVMDGVDFPFVVKKKK